MREARPDRRRFLQNLAGAATLAAYPDFAFGYFQSAMVHVAREAADVLAAENISVEIVDLRTLAPLDEDTVLESVRKTSKVLLLHEDTLTGGIGGELAARISEKAFDSLDGPILRVTAPDTPVPYSPPLEEAFLPNAAKVAERARWLAKY